MQKLKRYVTTAGIAALVSAAAPIWAESAPVFDADSFESAGAEQAQDLPMPPPPGEETASTHAMPQAGAGASEAPAATTFVQTGPGAEGAQAGAIEGSQSVSSSTTGTSAGVSVSTADLSPEERMRRLEAQLNALQNSESAQHVESLQNEVQSLRGQIEVLNHQIDKMQAQQKTAGKGTTADTPDDDTADVTAKTTPGLGVVTAETTAAESKKPAAKKLPAATDKAADTKTVAAAPSEVKSTDTKTASASVNKDQPNVAEEQKIYQTAYDFIKAKKYNDAVDALQDMLKKYPSGQFASNAHYWLGELYGLLGKNDKAFDEFSLVINKFPGSPRVSDAQLKLGLILAAQSKWPDAKRALKQVINTYPGTASARLASEQLKQIKTAGH